jgi:hypothetical protein
MYNYYIYHLLYIVNVKTILKKDLSIWLLFSTTSSLLKQIELEQDTHPNEKISES